MPSKQPVPSGTGEMLVAVGHVVQPSVQIVAVMFADASCARIVASELLTTHWIPLTQ